jgi:hypothetical protein
MGRSRALGRLLSGVLKKLAAAALILALAPGIAGAAAFDWLFPFTPGSGITSEDVGGEPGGVGDGSDVEEGAEDAAGGIGDWFENNAETLIGEGIDKGIEKIKDHFGGGGGGGAPAESANPDTARFTFDLAVFATLIPDSSQAAETMAVEEGRRDDYIERWDTDHEHLDGVIFNLVANQFDAAALASASRGWGSVTYASSPAAAVRDKAPGMRSGTDVIYSDKYKARRNVWRADMEGVLKANQSQTEDILDNARDLIEGLDETSGGAYGYLETMQAGAAAANYMNTVLLGARADMARDTDARLRTWLEKIQDDADEVSAFEQAVKTWHGASTGTGY